MTAPLPVSESIDKTADVPPSSYRGFKIAAQPATCPNCGVIVATLNLQAKSADGHCISGDAWEGIKAEIDALLANSPLPAPIGEPLPLTP